MQHARIFKGGCMAALALFAGAAIAEEAPSWHGELALGQWSYDASGQVRDNTDQIDFTDLTSDDNSRSYVRLGFSPAHRWLPDVLLERQGLEAGATGQTDGVLLLPGSTGTASADFDLTAVSLTLPLITEGVRVGLGVLIENVDGVVTRQEDGEAAQTDRYEETYPMGLLRVDVAPFGPFTVRVEAAYVKSGSDRAIHARGSLLWPVIAPLGLEFGLQSRRYRFTTSNYAVDGEFRGGYMGLLLKF